MTPGPSASDPGRDPRIAVPVEHRRFRRPWGEQHVVTTAPEHPVATMVLLHGWPQHWWAWRHVVHALGRDVRIVAIDTRGFGDSRMAAGRPRRADVTSEAVVADVVATMDDLAVERAHVVGHDWGGWFAFHLARQHPGRCASVTGLAIMPPWLSAPQVARHALGLLYLWPMAMVGGVVSRHRAAVHALLVFSSGPEGKGWWRSAEGRGAVATYAAGLADAGAQRTTRLLYERMVTRELWQALRRPSTRLSVPGLVLLGDHEQIAKEPMYRPKSDRATLRTDTIVGAGHWLLDESPDQVVAHLRRVVAAGT